jgi:hypothetical protein
MRKIVHLRVHTRGTKLHTHENIYMYTYVHTYVHTYAGASDEEDRLSKSAHKRNKATHS